MYSPNPILLSATPDEGHVLPVTEGRGGLAGYVLLGQFGPATTVETQSGDAAPWLPITYPHTLLAGQGLRLTRSDTSPLLTTIRALAPADAGDETPPFEPFTVTLDAGGYETIINADATADPDGYETVTDATATTDPDGYESVERTP